MNDSIITIFSAKNEVEARRVQTMLEENGIPCFLRNGAEQDRTGLGSLGSGFSNTIGTLEIDINERHKSSAQSLINDFIRPDLS